MNEYQRPATEPGTVAVEQGQVLLDGPDGIAIAMTPGAAEETGRRLVDAARRAKEGSSGDEVTDAL